jgi:hypothetical protein
MTMIALRNVRDSDRCDASVRHRAAIAVWVTIVRVGFRGFPLGLFGCLISTGRLLTGASDLISHETRRQVLAARLRRGHASRLC